MLWRNKELCKGWVTFSERKRAVLRQHRQRGRTKLSKAEHHLVFRKVSGHLRKNMSAASNIQALRKKQKLWNRGCCRGSAMTVLLIPKWEQWHQSHRGSSPEGKLCLYPSPGHYYYYPLNSNLQRKDSDRVLGLDKTKCIPLLWTLLFIRVGTNGIKVPGCLLFWGEGSRAFLLKLGCFGVAC